MYFTIEKIKPINFCFDYELYSKERDIMKKRIDKISKKIDKFKEDKK